MNLSSYGKVIETPANRIKLPFDCICFQLDKQLEEEGCGFPVVNITLILPLTPKIIFSFSEEFTFSFGEIDSNHFTEIKQDKINSTAKGLTSSIKDALITLEYSYYGFNERYINPSQLDEGSIPRRVSRSSKSLGKEFKEKGFFDESDLIYYLLDPQNEREIPIRYIDRHPSGTFKGTLIRTGADVIVITD